ncbi:hypothetical protein HNQ56_002018 [Anaerotaenia torta]
MMNGLQSELIKYKRTFTRKLIILAPLFFVLQAVPQRLFMPAEDIGRNNEINHKFCK